LLSLRHVAESFAANWISRRGHVSLVTLAEAGVEALPPPEHMNKPSASAKRSGRVGP